MGNVNRKVLIGQLITHVILLLLIVVLSIVFTPDNFESSFIGTWIFSTSIINYLNYFIPITAAGLAISFSIQIRSEDVSSGSPFFKVIQGSLVFLLSLMLVYTLLLLLVLPWAHQQQSDAQFRSDFIDQRVEQAIQAFEQRDYPLAQSYVDDVLNLVPLQQQALILFQEIQAIAPPSSIPPIQEEDPFGRPLDLDIGEILQRAQEAWLANDYFTAVFYSRLALGPDEDRDEPEARRILTESLQAISRLEPDPDDQLARQIFNLKSEGVRLYNAGDTVSSYYTFKELEEISPTDRDMQEYLAFLEPRIAELAFFIDEIDDANQRDIRRNVFFKLPDISSRISRRQTSDERTESQPSVAEPAGMESLRFFSADQMMRSSRGLYFMDMEYLEISSDGSIETRIRIPKAKVTGNYMLTRAIDREDSRIAFTAEYLNGRPEAGQESVLRLDLYPNEIWAVNPSTVFYNDVNILQLFSLSRMYPQYGMNEVFPQSEILSRLLMPFSLMNLSLLVILMAWRGRSRYINGPPVQLYLLIPLIPLFILALFDLYVLVFRSLLSAILILSGLAVSILVLVAIQAVIFVVILIIMARISSP